jgi:hypothetical protein
MADAWCEDINTGVEAKKRNRMTRFTAILPSEIPCETIESQVAENVSGNCFLNCGWNQGVREFGFSAGRVSQRLEEL